MTNKQKIKCLFGHHNYTIPHKQYLHILLCRHCKRFGYRKSSNGIETGYEFDEKGNMIHRKSSDDYETWYDKKGKLIKTNG